MRKFSLVILGIASLLSIAVLFMVIREIIPLYRGSDWKMILWAVLPILYFGFFFIRMFDKSFYEKYKTTAYALTIGLSLSLLIYIFCWVGFSLSKGTDPLGIFLSSSILGIAAVILTVLCSLIVLVIDRIKSKKTKI